MPARLAARLSAPLLCLALILSACASGPKAERPAGAAPSATAGALQPAVQGKATPLPDMMTCLLVSAQPTAGPTEASLFPGPGAGDHVLGPADAVVTFLEYTDYQAPASAALDSALEKLSAKYPAAVRRVFRLFPLPSNDKSSLAGALAEAAALQGKFWEMSAMLTNRQDEWAALDATAFQGWALQRAAELGLDPQKLKTDMSSPAVLNLVSSGQHFGLSNSIPTMPFLLVNGRIYQGPRDLRSLENLLNLLRMEASQFSDCPPFVIDPQRSYLAELSTTKGNIILQLYPHEAPLAVNNFVYLARQGWFNGLTFYRVIKGQLAQSGDPSGTGFGGPGYAFADELSHLSFEKPGVLAMDNTGPDSNGSRFFITLAPLPDLNGQYTIFGQVIQGQEVLSQLTARDPTRPGEQPDGDPILKIDIREQ